MAKTPTPAVSYLRVSGRGQVGGDGFPRQREAVRAYAHRRGFELLDEFRDEGVSGTTDLEGRDGLQALFDRIASNGVRVVLLERADRLARDLMVGEVILSRFRALGVRVLGSDGVDLTENEDPTATLVRHVMSAIAEFDKRITVRKLRAARDRASARVGRRVEGVKPFGTLPGEDAVVARMRRLRRKPRGQPRMGYKRIADTLNVEKLPTRTGALWGAATVRRVLLRGVGA